MYLRRYAIFHPLAYLVKLNIELSMADLIKKIALDRSQNRDFLLNPNSHNSALKIYSREADSLPPSRQTISVLKGALGLGQPSPRPAINPLANNEILRTEEFRVQSGPAHDLEVQRKEYHEQEVYDGSGSISYANSAAWTDVDWKRNEGADQELRVPATSRRLHL